MTPIRSQTTGAVLAGTAALLIALATAIGALGAHALKARWPESRLALLQTAVHYQFFHSLGLLLLATLSDRVTAHAQAPALRLKLLHLAARLLLAGIVIFCGSLYALAAGAPAWLGAITPLGGLSLIVAWLLTVWAFWSARRGA